MSDIGSWEPQPTFELDEQVLARLLHAASALQEDELSFSADEIKALAPVMTLSAEHWRRESESLSSEKVVALIRLFTLAETRLTGWQAGDKSPVIALAETLKHRGQYPADLTAWIRAHSDNRFLPYGNLMDRL